MANSLIPMNRANNMGYINSVSDLDNAVPISNGTALQIYSFPNTASNRPSTSGGTVLVIKGTATAREYFTQLAFSNNSGGPRIDARNHGGNGFTAWVNISGAS